MSITDYLGEHWGLLIIIMGIAILLILDAHLERRIVRLVGLTNTMLFLYSVSCYAETYLGNQTEYTILRPILSAFNYGLVTFILVVTITIMYPGQKKLLFLPAILNAILCFVSIPTGIVFHISNNNHFYRGPLGYLPFIINGLYLAYLIFNLLRSTRAQKEDYLLILFMSFTSLFCLISPLVDPDLSLHWFNITIAIDILLYYVYLLQQFTKRDPLTNLLNRQSYYSDAEKYHEYITAVVTMDMDGLKELNDSEGHIAGDTALKTLGDCFWRAAQRKQRVYRIGGDEYVILCMGAMEPEVKSLVDRIHKEVEKTPYTCSVGYAMKTNNDSIDRLYQLADSDLYIEKKEFYERSGKLRRKR